MSKTEPAVASGASREDRRGARLAIIGLVVLLASAYATAVVAANDRVPGGTSVGGVKLGGLSVAAAEDRLRERLVPRARKQLVVRVGADTFRLDPAAIGLRLDVEATVARAHGGSRLDPRVLWDAFAGGDQVAPVIRVEQDALIGAVNDLANRVDEAAVEPRVSFAAARVVPHRPAEGRALDTSGAVLAILDGWLSDDDPITLPIEVLKPELGDAGLKQAVEQIARPAVDGPVRLEVDGRELRLPPRRYAPALSVAVEGGELGLVVDQPELARRVPQLVDAANRAPRDATVRLRDGRPRVVPARPGVTVTAGDLAAGLLDAIDAADRSAAVKGTSEAPEVRTREARRWQIRDRVSSFVTAYPHAAYRNTNIGRAAELINGTVLAPGDTFSLNRIVGERTKQNGFTIGFVIEDGVFAEDYGGGVSQVATTTFNAAFFAGLEDVEHQPHSFYIDRYPRGREATVAWPSIDLRFTNTTPYGVLVQATLTPSTPGGTGELRVSMWSTKYWTIRARSSGPYAFTSPGTQVVEGESGCVPQTGVPGFQIDVYRDFFRRGDKVRTEPMHTTYLAADTVICR